MKKRATSTLEFAALACFIMGFALYVGVDTGVVNIGAMKFRSTPGNEDVNDASPSMRLAKIKALHERLGEIETNITEKMDVLKKMSDEVQTYAKRLGQEKKTLNSLSSAVLEIEHSREALQKEIGLLNMASNFPLDGALTKIASAARKAGVSEAKIGTVKWKNDEYLRLADAFEFQETGVYMLQRGMNRADAVAEALEDTGLKSLKIVYREKPDSDQQLARERAMVLRNHFKEVLGDDFNLSLAKLESESIATGSVEVWMRKR